MKFKLIIILSLISILSLNAKDYDKESLFNALVEKYGNLKAMSASINNVEMGMTGKIIAAKGHKYNVDTKDIQMVSDGETVWNYVKADKKVNINNIGSYQTKFSLDVIFFTFVHKFKVQSFQKIENGYVLELVMNEPEDMLDKLVLFVDDSNLNIYRIQIVSAYSTTTWEIVKLNLNPKIKKNTFKFIIPENAEIIDLR